MNLSSGIETGLITAEIITTVSRPSVVAVSVPNIRLHRHVMLDIINFGRSRHKVDKVNIEERYSHGKCIERNACYTCSISDKLRL